MKLVSLFSGCGGLDLGFEQAGYDIILANEFDKTIWSTYELNHPNTILLKESITDINFEEIKLNIDEIDGIIGGPPCQAWSTGGKRRGIDDPRGHVFFDYIRAVKILQPKFFVCENVPGILFQDHKKDLENFLNLFDEAEYNVQYKILKAEEYNIPQLRRRVIFVGLRKDLKLTFEYPTGTTKDKPKTLRDTIWDLQATAISAKSDKHDPRALNNNETYWIPYKGRFFLERNHVHSWDEPSYTITAALKTSPFHPQAPKMERNQGRFPEGYEHLYRHFTIREAARIQSFPDDFKFDYNKITDGFKMVGNAVPPLLAYEIAKSIKKTFGEDTN